MATSRYVALLRGVSPANARMPELVRAFELGGFAGVRTLLSSGNVVFTAPAGSLEDLQERAEQAMHHHLGRTFMAIVRSSEHLRAMLEGDPFAGLAVLPGAKRVVTFLRRADGVQVSLPIERDGASILRIVGSEVFTAYVPSAKGPVFMSLLERTFGSEITTRTLETVRKCAVASIGSSRRPASPG